MRIHRTLHFRERIPAFDGPTLGPTQPALQSIPGVPSSEIKRHQGVTLTTHPHLVLHILSPLSSEWRSRTALLSFAGSRVRWQMLIMIYLTTLLELLEESGIKREGRKLKYVICSSPNIIRIIKSRKMGWARRRALLGEVKNWCRFYYQCYDQPPSVWFIIINKCELKWWESCCSSQAPHHEGVNGSRDVVRSRSFNLVPTGYEELG
jgi:hypothetical protein